ncbi:RAQPRD family integrative conjugative element protein [Pasteurellaceae bacterium LIM206]|nr:RAQPRD family integrative conjugative element protein [Pasteurellaceae bacterium LIM206]
MRKLFTSIFLVSLILSPVSQAQASEQSELDQAVRQLESAKKALDRAQISEKSVRVKDRVYFDYTKARRDIDLVKFGISRYINSNRAQPRDPRQIRTLSGVYDNVKTGTR